MACVGFMAISCEPEKPDTILQQKPQRPTEQPQDPFPPKRMERWVMVGDAFKDIECDYTYTMRLQFRTLGDGYTLEMLEDVRRTSLIIDWENMTFKNYASNYGDYYGLVTGQISFVNNENIPNQFSTITFDPHLSDYAYYNIPPYQNWDIVWFGDDYTSPNKNHPFWYSDAVRDELLKLRTHYNLPLNQFVALHTDEADFTYSTMYFVILPYSE
jgi:hypothetical protein